nr:MAG TPA: hypothetical protein [Caudoviricetes sp.]
MMIHHAPFPPKAPSFPSRVTAATSEREKGISISLLSFLLIFYIKRVHPPYFKNFIKLSACCFSCSNCCCVICPLCSSRSTSAFASCGVMPCANFRNSENIRIGLLLGIGDFDVLFRYCDIGFVIVNLLQSFKSCIYIRKIYLRSCFMRCDVKGSHRLIACAIRLTQPHHGSSVVKDNDFAVWRHLQRLRAVFAIDSDYLILRRLLRSH